MSRGRQTGCRYPLLPVQAYLRPATSPWTAIETVRAVAQSELPALIITISGLKIAALEGADQIERLGARPSARVKVKEYCSKRASRAALRILKATKFQKDRILLPAAILATQASHKQNGGSMPGATYAQLTRLQAWLCHCGPSSLQCTHLAPPGRTRHYRMGLPALFGNHLPMNALPQAVLKGKCVSHPQSDFLSVIVLSH